MQAGLKAAYREAIARAVYEADPFYESGECVEGFQVSPGGHLTWNQACARDAEFADDKGFFPITKYAYAAADKVCAIPLVAASPTLLNMVKWCINHSCECLGDHPNLLEAARAAIAELEDQS